MPTAECRLEMPECGAQEPLPGAGLPRIAVVCGIRGMGGAEISLLELVARLRGTFEFHVIVPGDGTFQRAALLAGAKTWVVEWPGALEATGETARRPGAAQLMRAAWSVIGFRRRLGRLIEEIGAAAVVTNAAKAHVMGALARRPKGVPLIWYMRDGLEERALSRSALALLARRCDLAICISKYVEGEFKKYVSEAVATRVVYNIVDLERFRPGAGTTGAKARSTPTSRSTPTPTVADKSVRPTQATATADELEKGDGELWFGMVGAVTPLKGQDVFLAAAERVLERLPRARFLIVGDNPYATEAGSGYQQGLWEKVESSKLRGRVEFLGFREDVPRILSLLDVLVQANRGPEGLGRSVVEAMACGVPVIAVNQWGPAELIRDGETGLLFTPLDADGLAERMITLGVDAELRERMGSRGRRWIEENLAPEELAAQFAGILARAMGGKLGDGAELREAMA